MAARKGILVREFSSFEQAETLDAVVFDKTGTITHGQWKLLKIISTGAKTEEKALALAASLEQESGHFIAQELRNRANQAGLALFEPSGVTNSRNGIVGHVNNQEVRIGSTDFLKEEISRSLSGKDTTELNDHSDLSRVYISVNKELCAVFVFGDEIKQEASEVIRELKAMGYRLHLLSGDGSEVTGLLNPLIEVSAMLLSSLTVIGNTLLLFNKPD